MRYNNSTRIFDSGCIAHLCSDAESFQRMHKSSKNKLNLVSHTFAEIKGEGEILLIMTEQEKR